MISNNKVLLSIMVVVVVAITSGCASTQNGDDAGDPFESTNRKVYNFNDALDVHVMQPVARGYVKIPEPARNGVTNFFDNVLYLNVIANDLLQGKATQFASDIGRFVVNSTIGIGGLFDPATEMGLKMHDEDLGQTFGVWGMGSGAYLVLPLTGPDFVRDVPNLAAEYFLNPISYLNPIVTIPLGALRIIDMRANLLDATRIRDEAALDPYTFVREAYRQQREYKIYDGNPPGDGFDDFIEGEDDGAVLKIY